MFQTKELKKMKAVGNFIIVKDDEVVQKNNLGLIITELSDVNLRYIIGEVKPGSFVYFDKVAGSDLRIKGEKFKAIREQDVVVTMKDVNSVI